MYTSAAAAESFINCLRQRRRRRLENLNILSVIGGGWIFCRKDQRQLTPLALISSPLNIFHIEFNGFKEW